MIRYHDYHLDSYEVTERGKTITLRLVYGYPGQETDRSSIRISDVELYHFIHTDNAIITDIDEVSIDELASQFEDSLVEWNRMYRVRGWKDSVEGYKKMLEDGGYKAWRIESAIGFFGFIIGKEMINA